MGLNGNMRTGIGIRESGFTILLFMNYLLYYYLLYIYTAIYECIYEVLFMNVFTNVIYE
jgi:hypothetical protein